MRLTVGPLPAAVYWRRRLLVLGALALAVLVIVYACTGGPGAGNQTAPDLAPPTGTPTPSPTTPAAPSPTRSPSPSAFTLPSAVPPASAQPSGGCTDDEIELTAVASPDTLTMGQPATFTLRIKNISARTCTRDVGSQPQELQLRQAEAIYWSSDDCAADSYTFDRELAPAEELTFDIMWYGYLTRTGNDTKTCETLDSLKPPAGTYRLVARLGTKFSEPMQVSIRSSSG